MTGTLDEQYDFALLGTSLPLSILSAALARAGFSILHVDDAEHYGGAWSSVTLQELRDLIKTTRAQGGNGGIVDIELTFAGSDGDEIPSTLNAVNRHFAISLAPTLLPCSGPTIDVLIRSKVASYCTFRLLQQTAVYSNEGRARDAWPLRSVPSSKEDIFKDKSLSLVDKRRLMKLLQHAAGLGVDASEGEASSGSAADDTPLHGAFQSYLTSRSGPGFSPRLASDVAYGVALCASPNDSAATAMARIQRHIVSVGRYGNSAYLIGQYGGAGEMAQCYCRSSAVQGGTFVLGHAVKQLEKVVASSAIEGDDSKLQPRWMIGLDGIDGSSKVGCVVSDADLLRRIDKQPTASTSAASDGRQAMGILLLDRGMSINAASQAQQAQPASTEQLATPGPPPPETALVIFPPQEDAGNSAQQGAVWALQMGEGTFSCPKGTYLVYLCAALPSTKEALQTADEARAALRHARDGVLQLARDSAKEWTSQDDDSGGDGGDVAPLFECYMVREAMAPLDADAKSSVSYAHQLQWSEHGLLSVDSHTSNLATALDEATTQAEDLYWLLAGQQGVVGRQGAEVLRRRQRRTAGTYAVGRGLGGALPEGAAEPNATDLTAAASADFCDFFPVADADEEDH